MVDGLLSPSELHVQRHDCNLGNNMFDVLSCDHDSVFTCMDSNMYSTQLSPAMCLPPPISGSSSGLHPVHCHDERSTLAFATSVQPTGMVLDATHAALPVAATPLACAHPVGLSEPHPSSHMRVESALAPPVLPAGDGDQCGADRLSGVESIPDTAHASETLPTLPSTELLHSHPATSTCPSSNHKCSDQQTPTFDVGSVVLSPRALLPYSLDARSVNKLLRRVGLVRKGQVRSKRHTTLRSLAEPAPAPVMAPEAPIDAAPITASAKVGVSGTISDGDTCRTVCADHAGLLPHHAPTRTPPQTVALPAARPAGLGLSAVEDTLQNSTVHHVMPAHDFPEYSAELSHDALRTVPEALSPLAPDSTAADQEEQENYATSRAPSSAYDLFCADPNFPGRLVFPVKIHSQSVSAIVDTGSKHNFISEAFASYLRINAKPLRTAIPLRGVTGGMYHATNFVQVPVRLGHLARQVDLIVVPFLFGYDVLLGDNFLTHNHVRLDYERRTLEIPRVPRRSVIRLRRNIRRH